MSGKKSYSWSEEYGNGDKSRLKKKNQIQEAESRARKEEGKREKKK